MNDIRSNPFSLAGDSAVVTGGGTGIGFAIATALAGAGARVVLAGRRLEIVEQAAVKIGPMAIPMHYDVDAVDDAPKFVRQVEARVGPVRILVNNAGSHLKKDAIITGDEEFLALLRTHVLGAHALTRAFASGMVERGTGSIVFIASMASLFGIPKVVAYSAAKSAILGMVRTLATELSPQGVRVNAVAPGWIETEMSAKAMGGDPRRKEKILDRTPMARFGTPENVGHAVVYLSSAAASFVTGVVLPIDGGVSIGF